MTEFDPPAVAHAVRALLPKGFAPRTVIILGTGFGLVERFAVESVQANYTDLPGMPRPAGTAGHLCRLTAGMLWGVPTLIFRGRYHGYEGFAPREIVAPVRLARALGAGQVVLTNAAGGIREDLVPGTLMAVRDHINMMGLNPLAGRERLPEAAPFPSMGRVYDPELTEGLVRAGKSVGERVTPGVYAAVLGPSFETPAEVEYLRRIGADAVGMSTAPEAIAAVAMGMRVCALSLVTNRAGSTGDSHEGTLKAGADADHRISRVLEAAFTAMG